MQAQLEAFQQAHKDWYEYMARFSQSMGQPPPPPPPPMIPLVPPPPRDGTPVSHLDALFTFVSYRATFDLYLSLTYHSLDLRICFDLDNSHVQSHSRDLLQLDRTTICRVIKTWT